MLDIYTRISGLPGFPLRSMGRWKNIASLCCSQMDTETWSISEIIFSQNNSLSSNTLLEFANEKSHWIDISMNQASNALCKLLTGNRTYHNAHSPWATICCINLWICRPFETSHLRKFHKILLKFQRSFSLFLLFFDEFRISCLQQSCAETSFYHIKLPNNDYIHW